MNNVYNNNWFYEWNGNREFRTEFVIKADLNDAEKNIGITIK